MLCADVACHRAIACTAAMCEYNINYDEHLSDRGNIGREPGSAILRADRSFANHLTRFASAQTSLPLRIHATQWLQQSNIHGHAEEVREGRVLLRTSVVGLYRRTRTAVRSRTLKRPISERPAFTSPNTGCHIVQSRTLSNTSDLLPLEPLVLLTSVSTRLVGSGDLTARHG